ncbi:MAG: hypothetical protein ABR585_03420 [Gemmatimonadaceae bacterium]
MSLTPSSRRERLAGIGAFLYLWLMVGMFLGTVVLVLVVRWIVAALTRVGWDQAAQDVLLILVILAYLVLSWFIARALHRRAHASTNRLTRIGIPVVATVLAVVTFILWSNPGGVFASLAGGASSRLSMRSGAVWEFGHYPDTETLRRLKSEGVTAVITLEHPGDLVERQGIQEERREARAIGITLVEAPMLPWVSNNEASLNLIRSIARKGTGHYYVHCGLGRDRVNLVKHMLEGMGARTVAAEGYLEGNFFGTRIPNFERGQLGTFGDDKWLVPYPDKHEMLGNILQGKKAHMILALDTTNQEQRAWALETRSLFKEYAIPYDDMSTSSGDAARIRQIVRRILDLHGSAAVIVPLTPSENGTPRAGSETADRIVREFTAQTGRKIIWTTHGKWVPGQPVERGNTEMPPPAQSG